MISLDILMSIMDGFEASWKSREIDRNRGNQGFP